MRDRESGIPFGRPPVADIAVPPFATGDEFNSFHVELQLYLASLDAGDVTVTTFALGQLVERSRRQGLAEQWAHPEPHILEIAVATYFPAPWTPLQIHTELMTTGVGYGTVGGPWGKKQVADVKKNRLLWGSDPIFRAIRARDGSWSVTGSERGVEFLEATLRTDDDMVLYRQYVERTFAAPFGARYSPTALPQLDRSAHAVRSAWAGHTTLPYIAEWNERPRPDESPDRG
ncbi:hypothetical protein B0I08_103275 [Glaciihabitans tibetensis]|uniref:Uncharacterized protein n=1 Tax=Glaciihabitans tibetensis TaxID=1266600 RepID=A0A2T0VFT5_9MICO|nr:hypothetical protein [Glaciihabitans tibetensis]PRY69069.1 hypothetical protein B0I08_103275 [Glaciihabitans tibetensis]